MDQERWRQVDRVFAAALERPPEERAAFVRDACEGDTDLEREVQAMDRPSALWRTPVSGGNPVKLVDGVIRGNYAVLDRGVYYIDRLSGEARIQYFDLATRRSTTVLGKLGNAGLAGLTASADGRTILYERSDSAVDDLMLVESFR